MYMNICVYICVCIIYFNIVNHIYLYEYIDYCINNKIDMKEKYIYISLKLVNVCGGHESSKPQFGIQ